MQTLSILSRVLSIETSFPAAAAATATAAAIVQYVSVSEYENSLNKHFYVTNCQESWTIVKLNANHSKVIKIYSPMSKYAFTS